MRNRQYKAGLMATLLVTLVMAGPVTQAADTGMGTKADNASQKVGTYIEDSVITAKVKAALVEDKQVSALKIRVSTKDGVVTLTGAVPSAEVGQHALQLAAAIDGVKDVKSALTVKGG